jgi:hypothetical protein
MALGDELVDAGVLEWLPTPDEHGRTLRLAVDLQENFALNQPLASFALVAFELLDPDAETYALDVLSVVEAILDDPFPVLMAQANRARAEAVAEMKAEGIEYEERIELLEQVTYPKPLAEPLEEALLTFRETHPWVRESDLSPKSVVRDMLEWGRTFTETISHYGLARSEGIVLRYLSSVYRALRQTVPEAVRTDELADIIDWLGETIRQTDSSLLDEWEALTDPESVARASAELAEGAPPPPARPITSNQRVFATMVRNAMFQKVRLAARDNAEELAQLDASAAALTDPPGRVTMRLGDWEEALDAYWEEYDELGVGAAARSPELLTIDRSPPGEGRRWVARQAIDDPDDNRDFAIVAEVDLDASDLAGEPVIRTLSFAQASVGA